MGRRDLWDQVSDDLYGVLDVPKDATPEQIQIAWRAAAKRTHPDLGGSMVDFQEAEIAYQVLSDPLERARYDRITGSTTRQSSDSRVFYRAPSNAGWSPRPPTGPGPNGPTFTVPTAADRPAGEAGPSRLSAWQVILLIIAAVILVVVLFVFALVGVVFVIAGAAAGLGAMLRGRQRV